MSYGEALNPSLNRFQAWFCDRNLTYYFQGCYCTASVSSNFIKPGAYYVCVVMAQDSG